MSLGIGRYRKNGNRVKRLADVIKILRYAIKSQEQALKARRNALAAIKSWAGELRDDNSREVINQINDIANGK
jgi:DNA-binding Lrp family transcriptional regulator